MNAPHSSDISAGGHSRDVPVPLGAPRNVVASIEPPRITAERALVVLMRVPSIGTGKTRLAEALGSEATYELAEAFVRDTLATAEQGDWVTLVAFDPPPAALAARRLAPGVTLLAQPEGDLGARIRAALDAALTIADRAILIGSDTPDLPHSALHAAFEALDSADAVIGPATDGGFYLLGVRATHPEMFDGVQWSTDLVCERTVANLQNRGSRVAQIDGWSDVDDLDSLRALQVRLESGKSTAAATSEALARIALREVQV